MVKKGLQAKPNYENSKKGIDGIQFRRIKTINYI
jgi:hypothetical protein